MSSPAYYILQGTVRALGSLPLGFHYGCGRVFSWLAGSVIRYRRDVVMTNLARSFPDKKYKELKLICKQFYRHFGDIVAEAIWFSGCHNPKRLRRAGIAEITNPETLNEMIDKSPSALVLRSHSGNWEIFGGYVNYAPEGSFNLAENDMCVVYKKLSSKVWDEIMRKNRIRPFVDKAGYDGIKESHDILRYMLKHKDQKKAYHFITDQFPYKGSTRIDIGNFMNQPTASMDGGAKLAVKYGLSVLYMGMKCDRRGHYTMTYTPICEDASATTVEEIMKKYYSLLQDDINEEPWNYLWTHKRWK